MGTDHEGLGQGTIRSPAEIPVNGFGAVLHMQFLVDAMDVLFDRAGCDAQSFADLFIQKAFCQQGQYLLFALAEPTLQPNRPAR